MIGVCIYCQKIKHKIRCGWADPCETIAFIVHSRMDHHALDFTDILKNLLHEMVIGYSYLNGHTH